MAADPRLPAAVSALDHGILDAEGLVAAKDRPHVRVRQALQGLRLEDLGIVREVEGAAQLTTSTWSRVAALSARRSASSDVSAIAIT